MRYYFLELLACPICKHNPLILYTVEERESNEAPEVSSVKCKEYCGYLRKNAQEVPPDICNKCVKKEVIYGVLICPKCGRWYPIVDGIPYMLPDKYRDRKIDSKFIERYFDRIPRDFKSMMKIPDPKKLRESP